MNNEAASEVDYERAVKLGQRAVRSAPDDKNPYLPALALAVPDLNSLARVPLGTMSIPLDRVAGTALPGRQAAFASNFMPLLDPNTEFGSKWRALYGSMMSEGQRDPVKVLEYMHRYYAVEGNKRISVMKYLQSPMIEADVTRVLPHRTDSRENKVYFEFLDFYNDTRLNDVDCTEPGSYAELIALSGHEPGVRWPEEDVREFRSAYSFFMVACRVMNERAERVSCGDILLIYLQVFGYDSFLHSTTSEMRTNLQRMQAEVEAQNQEEPITIKMTTDGQNPGLLRQLFRASAAPVKVCFINNRAPEVSGWTYWHSLGRNAVDEAFKGRITTEMISDVQPQDCRQAVEQAAKNGAKVIFTTSPILLDGAIKAAMELPDVKVLNCSLRPRFNAVRSYYLRMYEAKFIMGAVAGAAADNNRIGYITDYPVVGMPSSINAFALGARMTNPRAKVYLEWSTVAGCDPEAHLKELGVNVICNRDIAAPAYESTHFGLYVEKDSGPVNLAMPVWNWGKLYEELLNRIANGQWDTDTQARGAQALNYWWGMDSGAIDVFYSRKLDPGTRRIIDLLHASVKNGTLKPFAGEIRSQDGTLRCADDEALTPAQIVTMDWLCDNVIGRIPELSELKEEAVAFVRLQGLKSETLPMPEDIRVESRRP